MAKRIKRISERKSGLVATCEICGKRSGSGEVPFVVDYWPKYHLNDERDGERAYRCKNHEPGTVDGDILEIQ